MIEVIDFASFCDALAVELDLPPLADDSTFLHGDDPLDSLLRFEILMLVEDWAGVILPDALVEHLQTLDDFYDIYCTRVSQRAPARAAQDP